MDIRRPASQLRTLNLASTLHFYTGQPGFAVEFRHEDFHGIRAGDQGFHLKHVDAPDPSIAYVEEGGHLHLHFETGDADAVAARLKASGVTMVREVHAWHARELVTRDDQGHALYFGQPR